MLHWHRSETNEELYDSPESLGGSQTVIQNRYCFWYKQKGAKLSSEDYESSIKQLASFQTVEHFWRIYNHLHRAEQVPIGTVSGSIRSLQN
jgi:Eukaryotic initiation factor 4E